MTDVDIFAKLSRILETHAVGGDEEEEGSVMELLHKIEKDGSAEDKLGGSSKLKNRKYCCWCCLCCYCSNFFFSHRSKGYQAAVDTAIMQRPSPYEVWQSKQAGIFQYETKEVCAILIGTWIVIIAIAAVVRSQNYRNSSGTDLLAIFIAPTRSKRGINVNVSWK